MCYDRLSYEQDMINYFADPFVHGIVHREKMYARRLRYSFGLAPFAAGDILSVNYIHKFIGYGFEGVCISLRKKRLLDPDVSITLRNVLVNVGVELVFSYYYARAYRLVLLNFKRKGFHYRRAKLYSVRTDLNRASRVK